MVKTFETRKVCRKIQELKKDLKSTESSEAKLEDIKKFNEFDTQTDILLTRMISNDPYLSAKLSFMEIKPEMKDLHALCKTNRMSKDLEKMKLDLLLFLKKLYHEQEPQEAGGQNQKRVKEIPSNPSTDEEFSDADDFMDGSEDIKDVEKDSHFVSSLCDIDVSDSEGEKESPKVKKKKNRMGQAARRKFEYF